MARAVLLLAVIVGGCAFAGPPQAEPVDLVIDPALAVEPRGPIVETGGGEVLGQTWRVVAFLTGAGEVCQVEIVAGNMQGAACGPAPGQEIGPFTVIPTGPHGRLLAYGLFGPAVRTVRFVWAGGVSEVPVVLLGRLELDAVGMATVLPGGVEPTAIVVLDAEGTELASRELGPNVMPEPAGRPTPAPS